MKRRQFNAILSTAGMSLMVRRGLSATTQAAADSVTGQLIQNKDAPAALRTDDGKTVTLTSDEDTGKVLHDPRLAGLTIEAMGHFTSPDQFAVKPIFEKNLFVLKNGNRLRITYWCDVCSIRTYSPGVCVCCQKWTDLDLRDPNQE